MKKSFRHKRVFGWKIVLIFLALTILWHLPLLLSSSSKSSEVKNLIPAEMQERYIVLQPSSVLNHQLSWIDPTVYLLPTDVGFSAELRNAEVIPKMNVEGSEPLPVSRQAPLTERKQSELSTLEALTMMETSFSGSNNDPTIASSHSSAELPSEGSAWRVVGEIAERMPANPSALPIISSGEPLAPTLLRIGVNAQGDVQFVFLDKSSGSEKADEEAIRFVKDIRFSPLDSTVKSGAPRAGARGTFGFGETSPKLQSSSAKALEDTRPPNGDTHSSTAGMPWPPAKAGEISWGIVKILWRAERSIKTENG